MSERKFAKGLGKPGTAAQLRETVSQVVRENTVNVSAFQHIYLGYTNKIIRKYIHLKLI